MNRWSIEDVQVDETILSDTVMIYACYYAFVKALTALQHEK